MFSMPDPVVLDEEVPGPWVAHGRVFAFIDDRFGWVPRTENLAADIGGQVGRIVEPIVMHRWKAEVAQRNASSPESPDAGLVDVGVATDARPPWEIRDTGSTSSGATDSVKPPWA